MARTRNRKDQRKSSSSKKPNSGKPKRFSHEGERRDSRGFQEAAKSFEGSEHAHRRREERQERPSRPSGAGGPAGSVNRREIAEKLRSMQRHGRPSERDRQSRHEPQGERFHEGGRGRFRKEDRDSDRPRKGFSGGGGAVRLKATVDKNRKGFAFLIFEDRKVEDAFVPPREAEGLFHGDRVEIVYDPRRKSISNLRVLNHRFREMVGRYAPHPVDPRKGGWVVYEHKRARIEVFVPEMKPGMKIAPNDWARCKLAFHDKGPYSVTGEILEVYGPDLPPRVDVSMIAAEYNLIEEHPEDAEREAREKKLEIPGRDLEGREDLREVPFITIDGETARDFDDAVYVEREKSGYTLWVGIADVSHYVVEGSALDRDARSRGTSVYFPERAFHMLPRALSENLCSLRPHEPRLAMVAKMRFDRNGKRLETEVMEGVILSKRRATYNEIEAEWQKNRRNREWEFAPHFELYELIKRSRFSRGSIDFELPEAEVVVKPTGEVVSIKQRPRLDAHRLIEEFMIAANEAVTQWMMDLKWPFVYRVHDLPTAAALEKFETLAATVGVHVSLAETVSPKVLADVVQRLDGHPAQALLNMALLRSMKQAVYSATHGVHFGLASPGYTHFTSPIRRYPDLVVHRLLRWALRVQRGEIPKLNTAQRERLEGTLAETCEHCSYRERLAADADREAIKLKQVRAMLDHLGDEFEGSIIGMADSGFFVKLEDPYVEGMVSKESMTDDFYQFNEERMVFYGTRKKRTFKIGDQVKVVVARANIDRRQIDFGLAGQQPPARPENRNGAPQAAGGSGDRDRDRDRGRRRRRHR
jgi:ribonuclease R